MTQANPKRVWVTGGAGYLGSAITEALDAQGQHLLCVDLGTKAADLVRERKLRHTVPISLDVTDQRALESFLPQAIEQHGLPDGVVHLAFASSSGRRLEELTIEEFQRTFDQSLPSTFWLCRELAERMRPRAAGSFVLFASMYGVVAPDSRIYRAPMAPNPIDYGASKAAMLAMARYFASHYGPAGIRFNCVTPGPFPAPSLKEADPGFIRDLESRTALRRVGRSSEIVGPTLFLLSDAASFVTGHSLVVDGGWTIH